MALTGISRRSRPSSSSSIHFAGIDVERAIGSTQVRMRNAGSHGKRHTASAEARRARRRTRAAGRDQAGCHLALKSSSSTVLSASRNSRTLG
eukprot:scaffold250031_cov49-Tisochrysis_lutea.AAC.3